MPMEPWQLQPARDTGLTPAERFRSVRRESGLLESLAQQACFSLLRIYFAIAHRLTISAAKNYRDTGHLCWQRTIPAISTRWFWELRSSRVIADALSHRGRRRLLSNHCSQCVLRNHAQCLADVAEKLWPACACRVASKTAGGKSDLHHLPGGWTHAHRFDDAFQHGLGMLVAETNVPVVPCGLIGTFEALPPNRKTPRPVKIKLVIGDRLQFASTANDRAGWSQIAQSVESAVRTLTTH